MGTYTREERIMKRVIGMAKRGIGFVSPNPMVGCVIYKDEIKIGEGFHEKFGSPHAEVNAIGSVVNQSDLRGAELFVNLEPCCHFGKTPPCTNLIIQSGIKKVVIANTDPFEKVKGKGIEQLRNAGIEVVTGIMEESGSKLNESFIFAQINKTPFVTLKIAQTLDGKISTNSGDSKWISNELSRKDVQFLRFESDGILTGIGTVLKDNPLLTVREEGLNKQPFRLILDTKLSISLTSNIVADEYKLKTIIFYSTGNVEKKVALEKNGIQLIEIPVTTDGKLNLAAVMKFCFEKGIHRILVESGGILGSSLIEKGLVNKLVIYQSPKLLGNGKPFFEKQVEMKSMKESSNLRLDSFAQFGDDLKLVYYFK